ncbi:MAG: hypothetical protein AAFP82_01965, partial [Bacteroidota bacterium]
MKIVILSLSFLLLLLQCTTPKPDWSIVTYGEDKEGKKIIIIDELHSYLLKTTDGEWRNLQKISDLDYSNHAETVVYSGKENIYLQSKLDSTRHKFKGLKPEFIGLWALKKGMPKEFVAKYYKLPDTTMFSSNGAEQWHYE